MDRPDVVWTSAGNRNDLDGAARSDIRDLPAIRRPRGRHAPNQPPPGATPNTHDPHVPAASERKPRAVRRPRRRVPARQSPKLPTPSTPHPDEPATHQRNKPTRGPHRPVHRPVNQAPDTTTGEADRQQTLPTERHRLTAGHKCRLAPGHRQPWRAHQTPQTRPIRRDHDQMAALRIDKRDRPPIRRDARPSRMTTQNHVGADRCRRPGRRRDQLKPARGRDHQIPVAPRERPQAGAANAPTATTATTHANALGPIGSINARCAPQLRSCLNPRPSRSQPTRSRSWTLWHRARPDCAPQPIRPTGRDSRHHQPPATAVRPSPAMGRFTTRRSAIACRLARRINHV